MALRTFVDSAGNEWLAFDVVPRADERRHFDRRSCSEMRSAPGDRRDADRRLTVGGRSPLASGVADGWLCFEHGMERRRLCPIPPEWARGNDDELEAYCHSARPVQRGARTAPEASVESGLNR